MILLLIVKMLMKLEKLLLKIINFLTYKKEDHIFSQIVKMKI
jgi:hypothetical protein